MTGFVDNFAEQTQTLKPGCPTMELSALASSANPLASLANL